MKKTMIVLMMLLGFILVSCTTPEAPIETPIETPEVTPTPGEETPIEDLFVETLLSEMTLEEKVGQMLQAEKNYITHEEVSTYNIGSILAGGGSHPSSFDDDADDWYNMVKGFQDAALASSSQIPLLFGIDAVHGHNNVYGATIFPHNINLGMTGNETLIAAIGEATAKEVKATGIHWNFSPAVSVARDIRWGRTYESFGEHPLFQASLTTAYIQGLQTQDVVATAKHFIADGGTTGGIDQGDAQLTEEAIRTLHLPPYIEAIEAGVESIMISFSSINGLKMHGNSYWVTDILKEELGFEGIIVSDWNATFQLPGDFRTQLVTAINAGIDVLMLPMDWKNAHSEIVAAVQANQIPMTRIDDAVTRILTVKYQNNLFTDPYHRLDPIEHFNTAAHRTLARQAAAESYVLLKNESALPLENSAKVYLTGPASDHVGYLSGGWTTYWQGNTEPRLGTGQSIKEALVERLRLQTGQVTDTMSEADVVIVVFTEVPYAEGTGDTSDPSLFGGKSHPDNMAAYQEALNAKAQGKTVIGLLVSGRPLILGNALNTFDGFVAMFLPGTEGGPAIVDVLYEDQPFTGKLSFTWPASLAFFDDRFNQNNVLFPVGYGLTYEDTKQMGS